MSALAAALAALHERVPLGMRLGLGPMTEACTRFKNPERAMQAVHIAGTNGKGSVAAMVERMLRAAGAKTGLYTSPHLVRFAERIRIDGKPIDDATLTRVLGAAIEGAPDLSFFETATLAAMLAFREANVDIAVLEVGMGGRLDATNVIGTPRASAITRIALDHTDRLGTSLVEIAREKAGIAKPGARIVLGPMTREVHVAIDEVAHAAGAKTIAGDADEEARAHVQAARIGLAGAHQRENARVAFVLGRELGLDLDARIVGLREARWEGRLERIGDVLLDGAHNPDGAEALAAHVRALGIAPKDVALVFGALADKAWPAMQDSVAPLAETRIYVRPGGRAPAEPAALAARHEGTEAPSVEAALTSERAKKARLVVVCGSLFLVGEARAHLLGIARDPAVAL